MDATDCPQFSHAPDFFFIVKNSFARDKENIKQGIYHLNICRILYTCSFPFFAALLLYK